MITEQDRTVGELAKAMLSIDEFCTAHGISRAFFYKLQTKGKAPRIIKLGKRTLISIEAATEWRRAMEAA
jgi:predicted DNA-binding transcriptional regulator AlpA